jgi:large subunit ribosomal protein L47
MTQKAIKQALTERYYSWREAEELAKKDGEINLSGDGPAYVPGNFVEDSEPQQPSSDQEGARPNA